MKEKKATPLENGWKYFAINLDIIEHELVKKKMDILQEITGKTKKQLFIEMIADRIDKEVENADFNGLREMQFNNIKYKRRKNEKGINSINSI